MTLLDRIAFNIVFNTALSFLGGLLIVFFVIQVFRIKSQLLKLYFYSLPFLKVIFDVIRGIPPDSYVWSDLNFYSLPDSMGRWLSASLGLSEFGPMVSLTLGVGNKDDPSGSLYSLSLPDVTYTWLSQNIGKGTITTIIFSVLSISAILVLRRIFVWIKFEIERRRDRKTCRRWLENIVVGKRSVDVYISRAYSGSPFTGGILRPYICFPAKTFQKLEPSERQSVIGHELAHIRHLDILQTLVVKILGDIFWFIPLYKVLSKKVETLRELVADQRSVSTEGEASSLAKALLKLKEDPESPPDAALYSAFAKRRSLISQRIHLLFESRRRGSRTMLHKIGVGLFTAVVTSLVLSSTFVGNYQVERPSDFSKYLSDLVQRYFDE